MFNIIIYYTTKQFYTQCYNFIEHVTTAQFRSKKRVRSGVAYPPLDSQHKRIQT